jgi:hypothetical protein
MHLFKRSFVLGNGNTVFGKDKYVEYRSCWSTVFSFLVWYSNTKEIDMLMKYPVSIFQACSRWWLFHDFVISHAVLSDDVSRYRQGNPRYELLPPSIPQVILQWLLTLLELS